MSCKVPSEPDDQWKSNFGGGGLFARSGQSLQSVLLVLESVGHADKRLRRISRSHLVNRPSGLSRKVFCCLT